MKGATKGHSRGVLGVLGGKKSANDACCFFVQLEKETLCFETALESDCDRWVAALGVWLEVNNESEGLSLVGAAFRRDERSNTETEYAVHDLI